MNFPLRAALIVQTDSPAPEPAEVPLKGVRIEGEVVGRCARTTVIQRFKNEEEKPVEAVYVFPLEEGAAVCDFRAKIDDKVIEGSVEEREKAFEIYDDAMAEGHGAFLLDQERPNIFTLSVGNLEPGSEVEIAISYVALLNYEGNALRLMLPTTVSPRYVPADTPNEVGQPDGERVNPPTASSVPYGLSMSIDVSLDSNIKVVESPSHNVRVELDGTRANVTLSQESTALDRDFVLLVEPREAHGATARVARQHDGTRVAMVTFRPDPDLVDDAPREVVFVLDCSGSMGGDSIQQARRALALCLRALQEGDTFNIVCFGSSFTSLWNEPKGYSQTTLDEATRYAERVDASMGGTEILSPLQAVLNRPVSEGRHREVLLMTDGQVSNDDQVINLCQSHKGTSRVFSFGIGAGASEHLVRGVARASGAAAEFIYPGERIEPKVLRMFGRVRTPAFGDISLSWGDAMVDQSPAEIPAVFAGEAVTVFGRVKHGSTNTVSLKAGEMSWELEVDLERADEPDGHGREGIVPTLWARHRLRDLEEGKGIRKGSSQRRGKKEDRLESEMIDIGKTYGLTSRVTSWVAVEKRSEDDKTTEQAELRKVPVAITAGWHGQGSVLAGGYGGAASGAMAPQAAAAPPAPGAPAPVMLRQAQHAPRSRSKMEAPKKARKKKGGRGFAAKVADFFSGGGGDDDVAAEGYDSMSAGLMEAQEAPDLERSAPEPEAVAASDTDRFYDLLMSQKANGSFPSSGTLEMLVGADRWKKAIASGAPEAVVATAMAVQVLKTRFADRKAEWSAAVEKARRWLESQGSDFDAADIQ